MLRVLRIVCTQYWTEEIKIIAAVFNLVEGIDVEETERRVKEYEKENAEGIAENEARKVGFGWLYFMKVVVISSLY